MDLTTSLKNEIFRPMTCIVIPGTFSIGPIFFVATYYFDDLPMYFVKYQTITTILAFFIVTPAGFILEDIGSDIEDIIDLVLNKLDKNRANNWDHYFKLKINDEYIGQRYLRTIHIRYKFELSMIPALILFWINLRWVNCLYRLWQEGPFFWITISIGLVVTYLVYQAINSAQVLGTCHESIVEAVEETVRPPAPEVPHSPQDSPSQKPGSF